MGNKLFTNEDAKKQKKFEAYLLENPKLLSRELLLDGKMLKTYSFSVENEKNIVMKVFIKRDNSDLKVHWNNYKYLRTKLNIHSLPNLLPYTTYVDKPDFIAIIRQKIHQTLLDRVQTIPHLRTTEKHWIIFQLLTAVYTLHKEGLYHGDIKANNVLLTTWNHVLLSDFAWHKPSYIFEDQLGEFQYFFSSSEKRCCLAPEKFITKESKDSSVVNAAVEVEQLKESTLKAFQQMDMFSVGCVIAEIMLGGTPLFSYEQLLAFRRDEFYPHEALNKIKDEKIRNLLKDIITKDPNSRNDAETLLKHFCQEIAPKSFPRLLYYLNSAIISCNLALPDQRVGFIREMLESIYEEVIHCHLIPHVQVLPIPIQKSQPRNTFLKFVSLIKPKFHELLGSEMSPHLRETNIQTDASGKLMFVGNLEEREFKQVAGELNKKKQESVPSAEQTEFGSLRKATVVKNVKELRVVLAILCSNLRSLRFLASKLCLIEMLDKFSSFLSDSTNLHFTIPYLFTLFDEENPQILSSAFQTFCKIISTFEKPIKWASEKKIFEDYLHPNLVKVCRQTDPLVINVLAQNMHIILQFGNLFIKERAQAVFKDEKEPKDSTAEVPDEKEEKKAHQEKKERELEGRLTLWRDDFLRLINEIVFTNRSNTQDRFISNLHFLAEVVGPSVTEVQVLPLAVSCLNTIQNKLGSLKAMIKLISLVTETTATNYLKPCFENCLSSSDELVVWYSIQGLIEILKLEKHFSTQGSQQLLNRLVLFLRSPNRWIRDSAIEYFERVFEQTQPEEIYFILQPLLLPYLRKEDQDVLLLNSKLFTSTVLDPLDRKAYNELRVKEGLPSEGSKSPTEVLKEPLFNYIRPQKSDLDGFKIMDEKIYPKDTKNLDSIIKEFYRKAYARRLFDIQNSDTLSLKMDDASIDSSRVEEVKIGDDNKLENLDSNMCLKTFKHFQEKVASELIRLVSRAGTTGVGYAWNLQTMNTYANSVFTKVKQLNHQKEARPVSYLRSEKTAIMKGWKPNGFLLTTIYEHSDSVNCLDAAPNGQLFASGSSDGTIKVFEITRLERDFSSGSVLTFNFFDGKDAPKIKALKFIDNDLLVAGGDNGIIEVYKIDCGLAKKATLLRQVNVKGEVKAIQPLIVDNQTKNKCFIYVTHSGDLGIEDLTSKSPAMRHSMKKETGIVSSLLASAYNHCLLVGTYSGFVSVYDIRGNIVSSIYQPNKDVPILSMANYIQIPTKYFPSMKKMVALSFGSDNHEIGVYDLLSSNQEYYNPEIYFTTLPLSFSSEITPLYIKEVTNNLGSRNISTLFSERMRYGQLCNRTSIASFITSYSDVKSKYFISNSNLYTQPTGTHNKFNYANKILSFPIISSGDLSSQTISRDADNFIVSGGNDMNIRYWNLSSSSFYHISNVDFKKRTYRTSTKSTTMIKELVGNEIEPGGGSPFKGGSSPDRGFSEYQFKNGNAEGYEKNIPIHAGHKDTINDLVCIENHGILVSCSRDHTVKVWK